MYPFFQAYSSSIGTMPVHLLYLLLLLCTIRSISAFCPNGCHCVNSPANQIAADCSRANLKQIPMFLNPRLKYLNLQGNQLSSLTMDELSFYPELKELDLSANQILTIERGAFASLRKLKVGNDFLYFDSTMSGRNDSVCKSIKFIL